MKPNFFWLGSNSHFTGVVLACIMSADCNDARAQHSPLFGSDDVLSLTLSGKLGEAFRDRSDNPEYHPMEISYENDGKKVVLSARVRTRGHFRKMAENCTMPPLLLNFSREQPGGTYFEGFDKLKLVTPCQHDKFIVREYFAYRLYNLVTDRSFRARLVKVVYEDINKGSRTEPLYGILIEDEEHMARRNNARPVDGQLVRPEQTNPGDFLNMALFEYMIGNTDWSVQYLQNVKLISADSLTPPITVPYDFDHSGLVRAPYAKPAPELQMTSVRERRYRGYCMTDITGFDDVIARFNGLKDRFYLLFTESPHLDEGSKKSALGYFDDFYAVINDPRKRKNELGYPCRQDGTGNVVIKGYKKE